MVKTVGSVCSGIEAASVAWEPLGFSFQWFSEIAPFPSRVLKERFPDIPNLGDMNGIAEAILKGEVAAPDLICGGTPCQAFSLAGSKKGLGDARGNLTLKFVDIIEANDEARRRQGLSESVIFWENVEGVLKDRTNAFGCLVSSLAGLSSPIEKRRWPNAGIIKGKKRNVAWRVLDAKYFGLPQQRKRLYVLAGGKGFYPETVLFEKHNAEFLPYPPYDLKFCKEDREFEVFREYADCLYSAYGTKWNGNAAAYNGSLFVAQDGKLRRFSPLECERLMGFPDNYTLVEGANRTNRYQAVGNSWAVPVIRWIGERLLDESLLSLDVDSFAGLVEENVDYLSAGEKFISLGKDLVHANDGQEMNCTERPEDSCFRSLSDIVSTDAPEAIYISPVGCQGILRRRDERKLCINPRLEGLLRANASTMPAEEIERRSRIQRRGKYSQSLKGVAV